jgi:hypothetical protein
MNWLGLVTLCSRSQRIVTASCLKVREINDAKVHVTTAYRQAGKIMAPVSWLHSAVTLMSCPIIQ